ncbi:MAG: hypothetical protein GC191_13645 [Azospirillum sp.]|nr:hypothetical protein [Azospirillum sp.]
MSLISHIFNLLSTTEVLIFSVTLALLMVFHHHKNWIVAVGFAIILLVHVDRIGIAALVDHFGQRHQYGLLYNLAILLPGFALVAHYFERSGFDARLTKYIGSDTLLLWAVFVLSIALDNIAAAMIGGVLLMARYGRENVPFQMLIGVIGAANLGGAGSFTGDTTTVMIFISGVAIPTIAKGFLAAIPAQVLLNIYACNHTAEPLGSRRGVSTPVHWGMFLPLLAIPGLAIGNIAFDEPGAGLLAGLALGCLIGRVSFDTHPVLRAIPNTLFLVTLVATAGMLPLDALRPLIEDLGMVGTALAMGVLSAFFDNIPLTALMLNIGGFDWGLTAYTVGFGGSAMWFGSSAGVGLGTLFPEVYNTRRWLAPFFAMIGIYFAGAAVYLAAFHLALPTWVEAWSILVTTFGLATAWAIVFGGILALNFSLARLGVAMFPRRQTVQTWWREAREEWH